MKAVRKLKEIRTPTGKHENETYCIITIYIVYLTLIALANHGIIQAFDIFKFSIGD